MIVSSELAIDMRLVHPVFGDGTLEKVNFFPMPNERILPTTLLINFDRHGRKELNWEFCRKKLEKL
jgi:hypothetical protein